MRILLLERVLANAIILGQRNFANLWLLPSPKLVGERIGIRAEAELDGFWFWFYRERCGMKLPKVTQLRAGDLGSVKLERMAEPGELGRLAFGPAVWVFSEPRVEGISGREMRAGYSDQPHVLERDRVGLGLQPRKASDDTGSVREVSAPRSTA